MESGSLLQEALEHGKSTTSLSILDEHVLLIDVFLLNESASSSLSSSSSSKNNHIFHLLELSKLAKICNQFLQSKTHHHNDSLSANNNNNNVIPYKWHIGGDGPIFGIHVTDGIPHLRAWCRYGSNVVDEWMAIAYMLEMSRTIKLNNEMIIAIACWDIQDGQVILIQASHVVPDWLDEDITDYHRHACWIIDGKIILLNQKQLTLTGALSILLLQPQQQQQQQQDQQQHVSQLLSKYHYPLVQQALQSWLDSIFGDNNVGEIVASNNNDTPSSATTTTINTTTNNQHQHRAAVVLPRKFAKILDNRPDLINTAILAFANNIDTPIPLDCLSSEEDWIWTIHSFSKTNYAMLRTIVSSKWPTEEFIPSPIPIEVKRYQRQCAVDATPHIRHAVQIGVRLVVGIKYLQSSTQSIMSTSSTTTTTSTIANNVMHTTFANTHYQESALERRIANWTMISQQCQNQQEMSLSSSSSSWILEAFQQGPNHALYNIENLLKCPVFAAECKNITLWSHPETSLRNQLVQASMKKNNNENDDNDTDYLIPRPQDVDDESSWMVLEPALSNINNNDNNHHPNNQNVPNTTNNNNFDNNNINNMMDGNNYHHHHPAPIENKNDLDNILSSFQSFMVQSSDIHGVNTLNNNSQSQLIFHDVRPRIFMNLLHAVLSNDDISIPLNDPYFSQEDYNLMMEQDDEEFLQQDDEEIKNLMNSMDAELRQTTNSRNLDPVEGASANLNDNDLNEALVEDTHVLGNLLKSLEAQEGRPGPVNNMLNEMGASNA